MPEIELKPCPFCGSNSVKIDGTRKYNSYHNVYNERLSVRCTKCHSRGAPASGHTMNYLYGEPGVKVIDRSEIERLAVELWNRRANENDTE